MCPMSPRLLRPRASGTAVHPEALDWATRVTANGGTVSSNTLAAVSTFCTSINAESGLRAAILRLNLFCGNSDASLNAVRTPLYLSGSFGGTTIGNTTDTNFNFVSGDYQETGSGGGLKGNGSSKYLNTGLNGSTAISSGNNCHLSYSGTSLETSGDRIAAGTFSVVTNGAFIADIYAAYTNGRPVRIGGPNVGQFPVVTSPGTTEAHYIGTRTSATLLSLYRSGSLFGTNTSSQSTTIANVPITVFALNNAGDSQAYTAGRLRMYSIGNGLTAAQALAFSNAVIAFNTALGRA
jgi:hypothetical protein